MAMKVCITVLLMMTASLVASEWTIQTSNQVLEAVELIGVDEWNLTIQAGSDPLEVPVSEIFWLRPVKPDPLLNPRRLLFGLSTLTSVAVVVALSSERETLENQGLFLTAVLSGTAGLGLGVLIHERRKTSDAFYLAGLTQVEKTKQLQELIANTSLQMN